MKLSLTITGISIYQKCKGHKEIVFVSSVLYCQFFFLKMYKSSTAALISPQVTKGMFSARKKFVEFVEVVDNDFTDESMYYNQPSMFPHRSDKDVSLFTISTFLSFLDVRPRKIFSCYLTLSCP